MSAWIPISIYPSLIYNCRYFLIIVSLFSVGTCLVLFTLRAVVLGGTSHLELRSVARPPSLLFVPCYIFRLGTPVNVCVYLLHALWLWFNFANRLTSRFFLNLRSVVYDNRVDGQSQATTVMALDDIRLTTWEFLRRRPQKSRTDIDTNAIVMDFRVERGVTVTEVSQVRQGDTSGTETQRCRSGSDRRSL